MANLPEYDIHVYGNEDELPPEAEELFGAELAESLKSSRLSCWTTSIRNSVARSTCSTALVLVAAFGRRLRSRHGQLRRQCCGHAS